MAGVRVITDSACDLTDEMAEAAGIIVVPLTIRFGEEELQDRRDITPPDFWRRCAESSALPETAAPSPGAFLEAYERAASEGAEAIACLTLSSGVSATYQSALTAAEGFGAVPVEVVDTRALTMGQGLLALAAADDSAAGSSLADITAATRERLTRTRTYGTLATLDHLQRGGRIGGARALLGSLLSIKPVVQVKDGVVAEESKQRTRSRSLEYLAAKVRSDAPLDWLAVCDGAAPDVDVLLAELESVEVTHPMVRSQLGPVVGTHTGPGTVGVCYVVR
jgi:DegV family protein with EDD domain